MHRRAARSLDGVARDKGIVDVEFGDVADKSVILARRIPIARDLLCLIEGQHGIEDRLLGQARREGLHSRGFDLGEFVTTDGPEEFHASRALRLSDLTLRRTPSAFCR